MNSSDVFIDPIVEEVRAARDQYAAQFNYDVAAIFADLRRRRETSDRTYVSYPPRRVNPNSRESTADQTVETAAESS